jgi:putative ABC transport system permease protein
MKGMNMFWQDIRYGIRMLLKVPTVSVVAIIALALGIGANTAIFSVVNAVLLRPLPFPNPDSLMAVFETDVQRGQQRGSYSYPNFLDLRAQNQSFERLASYHGSDFIMTGRGDPARLQGTVVTADLFPLLGIAPALGRGFLPDEDKPSAKGNVVILSQQLFQRRFNSDPNVLNQAITLDGKSYTVTRLIYGPQWLMTILAVRRSRPNVEHTSWAS